MQLHLRLQEEVPTNAVPVWVTLAQSERIEAVEKLAEVLAKAVADADRPTEVDVEEGAHE